MGRSSEHFDRTAATYEDPAKERRAGEIARAVVGATGLRPGARVLEYGAGTGLVSRALTGLVDDLSLTLADNSAGMREVLQRKVSEGVLPAGSRVVDLDLEVGGAGDAGDAGVLGGAEFDLVVSSLVLHHVRDLDRVLAGFAGLLAEGGRVAIADLDREDGSFHEHLHDFDGHHGFDREELAAALGRAGFARVSVADCTEVDKEGTAYPVFLATAERG